MRCEGDSAQRGNSGSKQRSNLPLHRHLVMRRRRGDRAQCHPLLGLPMASPGGDRTHPQERPILGRGSAGYRSRTVRHAASIDAPGHVASGRFSAPRGTTCTAARALLCLSSKLGFFAGKRHHARRGLNPMLVCPSQLFLVGQAAARKPALCSGGAAAAMSPARIGAQVDTPWRHQHRHPQRSGQESS
jgi:hypothetical protein